MHHIAHVEECASRVEECVSFGRLKYKEKETQFLHTDLNISNMMMIMMAIYCLVSA